MPCKPAAARATYTPAPRARPAVAQVAKRKGSPPKYQLGDFFCPTCGKSHLQVPLPFGHQCPGPTAQAQALVEYRARACSRCPQNVGGACMAYRAQHPGAEARVDYAVHDLGVACPLRRYLSHAMACPQCGYHLASSTGVSSCHHCGWEGEPHAWEWEWELPEEKLPPPTSSRCVLMVAAGEEARQQAALTAPRAQAYAAKCGADFHLLDDDYFPTHRLWNKYRASTVAARYKQLLFLDCDVVVQNDPPDLFALVPPGATALYDEAPEMNLAATQGRMRRVAEVYGLPASYVPQHEYNSGVTLIAGEHASCWAPPPKPHPEVWTAEQLWLMAQLDLQGAKVWHLGWEWNTCYFTKPFWQRVRHAYFVHLAGSPWPYRLGLLQRLLAGDYRQVVPTTGLRPQWHPVAR